ncbi:MAG: hypothetical protein ACYTEY_12995 [Planctomycetota bacterium]|jgi:leucyl-tRNA synthetase
MPTAIATSRRRFVCVCTTAACLAPDVVVVAGGQGCGDCDTPPAEIEKLVLADEKVTAALAGKSVKKLVSVPGRIVNIVAG